MSQICIIYGRIQDYLIQHSPSLVVCGAGSGACELANERYIYMIFGMGCLKETGAKTASETESAPVLDRERKKQCVF